MARVTIAFDGVRDGQVHPERFEIGSEVTGELARVAISEGWAEDEVASMLPAIERSARTRFEQVGRHIRKMIAQIVDRLRSAR